MPSEEERIVGMSDAELERIRGLVEVERRRRKSGGRSPDRAEQESDAEFLYTAISRAIGKALRCEGRRAAPFHIFARRNGAEVTRAVEFFRITEEMVLGKNNRLQRPERLRLYDTFAKLACLRLQCIPDGGPPLSEGVVLRQYSHLPSLLDNAYPGYGMLRNGWELLFRQRTLEYSDEEA